MSKEIRDGKTVWWLYQGRRVNTQTAGGGGALVTRISVPTGTVARVVAIRAAHSVAGSTTLNVVVRDEDGQTVSSLASVASAAAISVSLPSIGANATADANMVNSVDMIIGPGEVLAVLGAAAAINDTQTLGVVLLMSTPTEPTWDTTGSAGTPSLAASTISAANTLQAVVL